jgi:hypothetical protein
MPASSNRRVVNLAGAGAAKSICAGLCSVCNSYVRHITKAAPNPSFARASRTGPKFPRRTDVNRDKTAVASNGGEFDKPSAYLRRLDASSAVNAASRNRIRSRSPKRAASMILSAITS